MDLATYLQNAVKAKRAEELAKSDQLTLGELIAKCEAIYEIHKYDDDLPKVMFDFGSFFPTKIDSWRGSYDELALNYIVSIHISAEAEMKCDTATR